MAHILVLNPWHGGSHKAVIEGWQRHSVHTFTTLGLEPRHWKWRMRHSAWTFAGQAKDIVADAVWTTDMLDVATWRALAPAQLKDLPTIVYMHEHQAGYPDDHPHVGDLHFAITNMTSAASADALWFNSQWHHDQFFKNSRAILKRMPDYADPSFMDSLTDKSSVVYPGWEFLHNPQRKKGNSPPHLLMAARWQQDKGLHLWSQAVAQLLAEDIPFSVSCIGGKDNQNSGGFKSLRNRLESRVVHWGHLQSRSAYEQALHDADIIVSTANHEFFGIAMVEALAAGCLPCIPKGLAYPEVLNGLPETVKQAGFHDWTSASVVDCLKTLMKLLPHDGCQAAVSRFHWKETAKYFDKCVSLLLGKV